LFIVARRNAVYRWFQRALNSAPDIAREICEIAVPDIVG
jgi:hypothetical protein